MTDSRSTTNEQERARALEQLHELVIRSRELSSENEHGVQPLEADSDSAIVPADAVFDLIRRVRDAEARPAADTAVADATKVFKRSPARTAGADPTEVSPAVESDLPESLGRFEIVRQLGQGGYGIVFLAKDPDLQREVALKIPRHEALLTADLRARFVREAQAAAALEHPNIVQVHESGQVGLICYIVSQYVPGKTLAEHLEASDGPVQPTEAAQLMADLASAIHHAHSHGVLHRDLKPANVLLERSNQPELLGTARITDFGLARTEEDQSLLTATGAVIGTPAYMAPEQAQGKKQPVGTAADIYSLGAMLYELLTKVPPFSGDSVIATLRAVVETEPVPPRHRHAKIPVDLEAICLKCLNKQPEQRYATALGLHDDLQRFLRGEPVEARPVSNTDRLIKWCRRNSALAAMAGTSVALLILAAAASAVGWWSTSAALVREKSAQAEATRRYQETKGAIDRFFTQVSENELLDTPGLMPLRAELLQSGLDYYQQLLSEETGDVELPAEVERTHFRVADIKEELGEPAAALVEYDHALKLVREQRIANPDSPDLQFREAQILGRIGEQQMATSELEQGLSTIDAATKLLLELSNAHPQNVNVQDERALAFVRKGGLLRQLGRMPEARDAFTSAVESWEQLLSGDEESERYRLHVADAKGNLSNCLRVLGSFDEARVLAGEVADDFRLLVERNPAALNFQEGLAKALGNLAIYHQASGDSEQAIKLFEEALAWFDRLALIHPQVTQYQEASGNTSANLAVCQIQLNQLDAAAESFRKAKQISQQLVDDNPKVSSHLEQLAHAQLNLGTFFNIRDEPQAAKIELESAVSILTELIEHAPDNVKLRQMLGVCHINLGTVNAKQDQDEVSIRFFDKAEEIFTEILRAHPQNRVVRMNLVDATEGRAVALERCSRFDEAIADWKTTIELAGERRSTELHLKLTIALAGAGSDQQASETLAAVEPMDSENPDDWYLLARARARVAEALLAAAKEGGNDERAQELQEQAVQALRTAESLGQFSEQEAIDELIDSEDFASMAGREDFQALVHDLGPDNM